MYKTKIDFIISGANGFLGSALVEELQSSSLLLLSRSKPLNQNYPHITKDIRDNNIFPDHFDYCESVLIHCAGLAHSQDKSKDASPLDFSGVNTAGSINLAKQASKIGVKRLIFISTIGVNGALSQKPFDESDPPNPHNEYSLSKLNAENELLNIASKTDLEVVIIRPPLIYGPNPPGNFSVLLNAVRKSIWLPFSQVVSNRRSLIALDNLISFIVLCSNVTKSPQASNQIYLISDGDDVSTSVLLRRVANAFGLKSRLFPFPVSILKIGAKLLGKQVLSDSLLGTLQINNHKARTDLGWSPVISMEGQLKKIAEIYGGR